MPLTFRVWQPYGNTTRAPDSTYDVRANKTACDNLFRDGWDRLALAKPETELKLGRPSLSSDVSTGLQRWQIKDVLDKRRTTNEDKEHKWQETCPSIQERKSIEWWVTMVYGPIGQGHTEQKIWENPFQVQKWVQCPTNCPVVQYIYWSCIKQWLVLCHYDNTSIFKPSVS